MEGHGVVEVDIPDIEPMPGSKYGYLIPSINQSSRGIFMDIFV